MAQPYNKINQFVEDMAEKVHNLGGDELQIYLSNVAPDAEADAVKADLAEIATGNGYTGPEDTQQTAARSTTTYTVTGTKVVFTATAGGIAQFRYIALQNTTPTSPLDPLIAWWDHGEAVDLDEGETFTVKFNNGDPTGTILTLA